MKILYTRTTDIIPGNKPNKNQGLRYRAEFANQSGGDLFIAIHVNAAPKIRHKVPNGYKYVGKGKKKRKVGPYTALIIRLTPHMELKHLSGQLMKAVIKQI